MRERALARPGYLFPLTAVLRAALVLLVLAAPAARAASTTPAAAAKLPATRATRRHAAAHGAHAKSAPVHRGPPPPAWTIRPKHHQTAVTVEGYSDGETPPWTARSGCASTATPAASLPAALGVSDPDLLRLFALSNVRPHAGYAGCVPFALLTNDDREVLALALVASEGADAMPDVVTFSRESPNAPFTLRSAPWLPQGPPVSVAAFDLDEALARDGAAAESLPPELLFEVAFLARSMLQDLDAETPDSVQVVVAFQSATEPESARLLSLELLDRLTSRPLRQVLWVPREDVPGGYFTPNGESLEPVFWTNPVNFRYISRGVGRTGPHTKRAAAPARRPAASRKPRSTLHIGVDFIAATGTPAIAVADGTVLFMGYFGGYGNLVIVQHAGGYTSHYGHLSAYAPGMAVGTLIRRGATLGYVGATGLATAPHLHFEIRHEGDYLDPLDQSLPIPLWSLRRADYATLARQMLAAGAVLGTLSAPPPAETPPPKAATVED